MVMNLHQYRFKNALTSRRKRQNKVLCLGLVYWGDKTNVSQWGNHGNLLFDKKFVKHNIFIAQTWKRTVNRDHPKFFSSNQLFTIYIVSSFGIFFTFTKFLSKEADSKFHWFPHCDSISYWRVYYTKYFLMRDNFSFFDTICQRLYEICSIGYYIDLI